MIAVTIDSPISQELIALENRRKVIQVYSLFVCLGFESFIVICVI